MKKHVFRRLVPYLRPYAGTLLLGCLAAVLQVAFTLAAPVLVGKGVDCVLGPGRVDFDALIPLLVQLAAVILLAAAFQWAMNVCTRRASALAAQDLRQKAFDRLNEVPLSTIDSTPHGDLVSRLVNDADAVSEGLLQGLTQLLPGAATIVGVLGIMLRLNWGIALLVALVTPLSIFFAKFVAGRTHALYQRQAAARAAHAHGFIQRLPQGYDTVLAAGGSNLSAGQKQLLCIARILLCRPQMLILDEATSNIDTRTEMLVQAAFERLMEGRTSFVVAHRLSTIQTADTILVMDAGRIVEQGTHAELLAKRGFYAKLYNSQFAVQ